MIIVLFEPQIPQNTGNVVRTCAVTGCGLVLVNPGFSTSNRWLKRAGLDYWEGVDVQVVEDFDAYLASTKAPAYFFSSKAEKSFHEVAYPQNSLLVFGSETSGLPEKYHEQFPEQFVTLPMRPGQRCLNLATSVGIGAYRAWESQGFSL